ncbi:Uncharacterized protein ALO40_05058 [Pseudomonas syringae pv. viburni]|uniref:Uncharacterized protein n=1 Tax=Pseudomonas syringae pv. viburni TaxID=251703 RepID=A0A0Q0JMT7_9PSED|nr:Uncharacterized protein ALO40_05058 [Pseudomonas syringae pv. viburni]
MMLPLRLENNDVLIPLNLDWPPRFISLLRLYDLFARQPTVLALPFIGDKVDQRNVVVWSTRCEKNAQPE